jgi:hypothetical protein
VFYLSQEYVDLALAICSAARKPRNSAVTSKNQPKFQNILLRIMKLWRANFTPTLYPSPQGGGDASIAISFLSRVLGIEIKGLGPMPMSPPPCGEG